LLVQIRAERFEIPSRGLFDSSLLGFDLRLLFAEGVDEKDAQTVVFDAFDILGAQASCLLFLIR